MSVAPARYGHGIDLRPEHYRRILDGGPLEIDWAEIVSERVMDVRGGPRLAVLEKVRRDLPLALHGTRLSIGSVDPLRSSYLDELKSLIDRVQPAWVSDHLAWCSLAGGELDLFPLPYTEEALSHVVGRVVAVQERLRRQILLENPSNYLGFHHSTMTEWEFLAAVAERADCGILLDINNLYLTARNLAFDPIAYLDGLPRGRVCQLHVAGHRDLGDLLIDTHQGPVPSCVWDLYREALRRFGCVSTIVEWDTAVPDLEVVVAEARRASDIASEVCREAC